MCTTLMLKHRLALYLCTALPLTMEPIGFPETSVNLHYVTAQKIKGPPLRRGGTKVTNTHSLCLTYIAFPRQQWLRERSSMIRYTYFACLVYINRVSLDVL